MRHKLAAVAVAVAGIGVAGLVTYNHWPSSLGSVAGGMAPVTLSPLALPIAQPDTAAPVAAAVAVPEPGETRTAMVNRLIKSADAGNAKDAYLAFLAMQPCVASKHEAVQRAHTKRPQLYANVPTEAQACEGIDAGQLTSVNRLVVQAAENGVPKAFTAAVQASAFDDPPTYDRVQQAAISKGDTHAMLARASEILSECRGGAKCSDDQKMEVVKLRIAADIINKAEGRGLGDMPSTTTRIVASLGPRGAQATEQGRELARAVKGVTQ